MDLIVDTSIWIDFFRCREPNYFDLAEKLEAGHVIGLSWIFGELLQATKNSKETAFILEYWRHVKKVSEDNIWIEAGTYANKHKLLASGVGLIDAAILIAAIIHKRKIWTLDKKLAKAADRENLLYA